MPRPLHILLVLVLALVGSVGFAAVPIEELTFASPELEERYEKFTQEIRCPMCLNSNLAGSDAPIAADLRAEIFKQLHEGRSDEEILAFLKTRYGDFISYRPPLNGSTALLWFGPLALLLSGFFVIRRMLLSTRAAEAEATLSPEELGTLQSLLDERKDVQ